LGKSFYIATFGCRTNQADSAGIHNDFLRADYEEVQEAVKADVIIINSCTVTQRSDQQVRQFTRKIHRENPRARIILTGCYAQRDPDSVAQVEGVSLVAGNTEKNKLVQLMDLDGGKTSDAGSIFNRSFEKKRSFNPSSALPIGDKTRPLVKIQDGCDARCSYCIVPTVRGPSRSIPPELILEQVD
jgi:threonylcarbamoyladenosine tRNA methylthiotransferase MtaB